jgi:hypothetical protein
MKAARTLFALLLVAALSGCGAHTSALFQDEQTQNLAMTITIAKAIEATDDPRTTATALLTLVGDQEALEFGVLEDSIVGWFGSELSPSETLLVDAVLDAMWADAQASFGASGLSAAVPSVTPRIVTALVDAANAVLKGY